MYQGTLRKGGNVPFGPHCEALRVPAFAMDTKRLTGIIRSRPAVVPVVGMLGLAVLAALPVLDSTVPFDPFTAALFGGLAAVLAVVQAFLWTRRCDIAVVDGVVRVRQSQAVFPSYGLEMPVAECHGVCLFRVGEGRRAIWSALLVHDSWDRSVPLSWRRTCRAASADVVGYAAALGLPTVETGDEPSLLPADVFNLPLADKVARGLVVATKPGLPPPGLAVDWGDGDCVIRLSAGSRLRLHGATLTLERRRFRLWWTRRRFAAREVLGIRPGLWMGMRRTWPAVVLRTADGLYSAGPCPDDAAARWLRAALVDAVAG